MRKIGRVSLVLLSLVFFLVTSAPAAWAAGDAMNATYSGTMTLVNINEKFIRSFHTAKEKAAIEAAADDVRESVIKLTSTKYSNIIQGIKAAPKEGSLEITITKTDEYKNVAKGDYIVYTNAYNGLIPALAADGKAYWIAYNDNRNGEVSVSVDSNTNTIHLFSKVKDAESGVTYGYKVEGGISGNVMSGSWAQLWNETEVYAGTFRLEKTGESAAPAAAPTTAKPAVTPQSPAAASKGADTDPEAARVSGCTGQVEIRLPGADEDDWHLVKMDTVIPVGAHIRTQEDSSVILNFPDQSIFVLKPESEIYTTSPPGPESKIKLVAGNIWANVKRIIVEGSMEVEMCQAVAGIKGTTFVCEESDGKSTLKVIEGTVEFTAKADGKKTTVTGGNMISANQNGLGPQFSFDATAETALWEKVKTETETTQNFPFIYIIIGAAAIIIAGLGFILLKKKRLTA